MSDPPMYRTKLSAAYSPGRQRKQNGTVCEDEHQQESVDGIGSSSKSSLSPVRQHRNRAGSAGNCAYEGLIFDRMPEETERMSKKLSRFIDSKSTGSNSFLSAVKGKMRSQLDPQRKRASTLLHPAASSPTTIITRQISADCSRSYSHLAQSDIEAVEDSERRFFDVYSLVLDDPEKAYALFMKAHRCYDVIPTNGKLIILDIALEVRKAFYAMVYNSVRAAVLWNSDKQRLCGMLTITDFILILLRLYRTEKTMISTNLETQAIREWRDMLKTEGKRRKLITVTAGTSLYRAVRVLLDSGYHRVPVLDEESGNPVYFLTHKRILRYLYVYLEQLPRPNFMNESILELGVGTYKDVQCVHPETPLVDCLDILTRRHMSAVPVIEPDTRIVVDIYARFDAIGLAAQQSYDNLDKTVAEALLHRKSSNWYEGVLTCVETATLWDVVQKLVLREVHGLVVVDSKNVLRGVLTLSDVLRFLVLTPIMERDCDDIAAVSG